MRVSQKAISFLILVQFLINTSFATETGFNLSFRSDNKSLWGATNQRSTNTSGNLVDLSWNESKSVGDVRSFSGQDFGARINARTDGQQRFSYQASAHGGSVSVNYPVKVTINYPDKNSFRRNDEITITTSVKLKEGWYFKTTYPKADIRLLSHTSANFGFSGEGCFFGCANFSQSIPAINHTRNIFTLNENGISFTKPAVEKSNVQLPYTIQGQEAEIIGISGTLDTPKVMTQASLYSDGRRLRAYGEHNFIKDLSYGLFGFASKDFSHNGFGGSYSTLGVNTVTNLTQIRDLTFDPNVKITMTLEVPMNYKLETQQGHFISQGSSNEITFTAGNTIKLTFPDSTSPIAVTPKFTLSNKLSHQTTQVYDQDVEIEVLKIEGGVKGTTVIPKIGVCPACTPAVTSPDITVGVGPLYKKKINAFNKRHGLLPGPYKSWEMPGFQVFTRDPFLLDPENPIIGVKKEVAKVDNLGGGVRDIHYVIKVANEGDVDLNEIAVNDYLEQTFANQSAEFSVTKIKSCELEVNDNFNGVDQTNLLYGNNIMRGSDTVYTPDSSNIYLKVQVRPQVYPPLFKNVANAKGTSDLGTVVTAANSGETAQVDFGPAKINKLENFALYASQVLLFEQAGDVTGNVGSNQIVHISKNTQMTIAGDIHAKHNILAQGELITDYIFSGHDTQLPKKSNVMLSGAFERNSTLNEYVIPTFSQIDGYGDYEVMDMLELEAGDYGSVVVASGAELILTAGEYNINELILLEGAKLTINDIDGEITANISNQLVISDDSQMNVTSNDTRNFKLATMQTKHLKIGVNARVKGSLYAPMANITFQANSSVNGAVYAQSISMRDGATAKFHEFWQGNLYKGLDLDCDGELDFN